MRAPLVARREPVGIYRRPLELPYVFEQKTQYILIHAPYTRMVVFWHISNIPAIFLVKFVIIPLCFALKNIFEILLYSCHLVVITYGLIDVF